MKAIAFSPDGRTLATSSGQQAVIWDITDQDQLRQLGPPLTGHDSSITTIAFSPDGHTLATASDDDAVFLWDMRSLEEIRRNAIQEACTRAGGPLDEATWDFYLPGINYQNTCANQK